MRTRQEERSEETKRTILSAAGQLFSERGFDAVSIREIAKAAGCSHTTIYLYFKDKEALLHELSMEPLEWLREQMESIISSSELYPERRLKLITQTFINFCLRNRNMYTIFFMAQATRVDEAAPVSDINQLRLHLFGLLRKAIRACMQLEITDHLELAFARIYFFTLHGITGTYTGAEESADELLERLSSTFDLAADVLLSGFKQTIKEMDANES